MGIDKPTPGADERPKRYGYNFIDAVAEGFFSPEDQAGAEEAIELYTRFIALDTGSKDIVRHKLNEFVFALTSAEDDMLRQSNVFHLFYGSGRTEERWRSHRLHTEDGKFEEFLKDTITPLITSLEHNPTSPENN